jgi:methanogenic corrinoid protein MtbC1
MEVLRAWERRFGFPRPERRPGSNRRLYSKADVERLLALRDVLERGYRIGDVITKSLSELIALGGNVAARALEPTDAHSEVARLVELVARDEITRLDDELRSAAATLGPKRFVTQLAHPLATEIGDAWASGRISIRHEHVATECLTTRVRHVLAGYQDVESRPLVLLTTLPTELHTLGLQLVALYLVAAGAKPRLLGGSTPPAEVVEAAHKLGVDVVGLTVTEASDRAETRRGVRLLARQLPESIPLWIGGSGAAALDLDPKRAHVVTAWAALDEALAAWRNAKKSR